MAFDSFGLTFKQRLFCEHYIRNGGNGTKSAEAAGYSKHSACVIAEENLRKPVIKRYLEKQMREIAKQIGLTEEYMLSKMKTGIEHSIPSQEAISNVINSDEFKNMPLVERTKLLSDLYDVRGGVACISEANKMIGNYAPEKQDVSISASKVDELVEKFEKEF